MLCRSLFSLSIALVLILSLPPLPAMANTNGSPASEYSCKINFSAFSFNELSPSVGPDSPVNLSIESVIELFLTDPLGRKDGYDYSIKKRVQEIPNSEYYMDTGGSCDGSGPPLPRGIMLNISLAPSGDYKLSVIGIHRGGYILSLFTEDNTGDHGIPRPDILGIISPGTNHTYQVHYEQSDVRKFNITKIITPGEIGKSLQTAFSLNWIEERETMKSLTRQIDNAESALTCGKINTAINHLNTFINEVQTKSGKHIKKGAADILTNDARAYIKQLQRF